MNLHLPILPILAPFLAGVLLLALPDLPMPLRRRIAVLSASIQIAIAVALLAAVGGGEILVYRLGDWPAPWGIVLVADRLAAWMVLITTLLALFAVIYAGDGLDRRGRHFHVLFQMQMFGLAGAFLTGDLFNLFVFFETLLIASYGLLLHGGGRDRIRAGLHYVVLNLIGSTVFLFAAGLIYASLGSLNLADIATRAAQVAPENLGLARAGGLLLLAVFALKAALLPLSLWLPAAYAHTSAPVAALFAIMTKVGAYAILRVDTLVFAGAAGALADLFTPWLLPMALATLSFGMLGALAAQNLRRLAAWLVVASVGTLLTAFSLGTEGIAAGLYYLPHGSIAAALLFLLAESLARRRPVSADFFTPDRDMPHHALWGGLFFASAVAIAGLPPLPGFVGKFLLLRATHEHPAQMWIWGVILLAALVGVIALARAGSRLLFSVTTVDPGAPSPRATAIDTRPEDPPDPPSGARELVAILGLFGLLVALAVAAGPAVDFARATAAQLGARAAYIHAVLGEQP
ncbi:MAG: monovalent cation/H+ antiporter subunit D [Sterolibacteriaceae bacterium]|nr:monovalent cation/H+ antiporter subunit D [Sterolibacteriaceae bacterium]MBK9083933.1 monovalent cation/H+ antiporter subunit D [Sterolibacteriaceae bacterium]